MAQLTLLREQNPLAAAEEQRKILEQESKVLPFAKKLVESELPILQAESLTTLQVNLGKLCNQTCRHCHVDAGPDRRETMSDEVAEACLKFLDEGSFSILDITGGAPEMHAVFRKLVLGAKEKNRHVIDRCNLTILEAAGYEDLGKFLADHQVEIIASLPCYLEENVDRQRGDRVFQKSIAALKRLNELGYGKSEDSELRLSLVYNPTGPSLPPDQQQLEADYKRELRSRYGIEFNRLLTITNLPISRFLDDLLQSQRFDKYMQKLEQAFNPRAISGLMCRSMISVDYEGYLYDCDFNQMLEMKIKHHEILNVKTLSTGQIHLLKQRLIETGNHCYGCAAGAGSSCGGAITYNK